MAEKTAEELEKELKKVRETFEKELKRKDKIIEELRQQNALILKSALKESEKLTQLTEKVKKLVVKKS